VDDPEHPGVIEEAGHATGIYRDRAEGEYQGDMCRSEIEDREQAGRQLGARRR
jgi:hypothetical protein